jgi:flagellar biogenesis protein FliO
MTDSPRGQRRYLSRSWLGACVVAVCLAGGTLVAAADYESTKLNLPAHHAAATTGQADLPPRNGYSFAQVALALTGVLTLVFVLRWAGRRFLAMPGTGVALKAIQVLARTNLSARQQLILVRFGKRLVLVASNGVRVDRLSEIADEDEVAQLLGKLAGGRADSSTAAFTAALGQANQQMDETLDTPAGPDALAAVGDQADEGDSASGPMVSQIRSELTGLGSRVRDLAKRLQKR